MLFINSCLKDQTDEPTAKPVESAELSYVDFCRGRELTAGEIWQYDRSEFNMFRYGIVVSRVVERPFNNYMHQ